MFQEGTNPRDPNAGNPGYSPNLCRGLEVPIGARIQIWIPHIYTVNGTPANIQTYRYRWMYRMRNIFEYRADRGPFHLIESDGVTDTTPGTGGPRILKPAAYRSYSIAQAEPAAPPVATIAAREQFHVRPVDVDPYSGHPPALPLMPDGTRGVVQQGVVDPQDFGAVPAGMPLYDVVNDVTTGDELLFAASRDVDVAANYDFTVPGGADALFFRFLEATSTVGIYVFVGKVPSGQNSFA
jgi:hypothetical protein